MDIPYDEVDKENHLIALALARTYGRRDVTPESLVHSIASNNGSTSSNNGTKTSRWTSKSRHQTQLNVKDDPFTFLTPLDDTLEWEAHAFILERLGLYNAAAAALRTYKDVGTILHLPKNQVSSSVN